jgi:hypothetical protein
VGEHLRGFNTGDHASIRVRLHCGNLGNAGVIRRDRSRRQAGERRNLLCKRCGARLQVQPLELQLGRRQPRLQQIAQRIYAGLGALLLDGYQRSANASCWRAASSSRLPYPIRCSRGGIQRHLLAGVLETEIRRLDSGTRSFNVLFLGRLKTSDCAEPLNIDGTPPVKPTEGNAGSPEPSIMLGR